MQRPAQPLLGDQGPLSLSPGGSGGQARAHEEPPPSPREAPRWLQPERAQGSGTPPALSLQHPGRCRRPRAQPLGLCVCTCRSPAGQGLGRGGACGSQREDSVWEEQTPGSCLHFVISDQMLGAKNSTRGHAARTFPQNLPAGVARETRALSVLRAQPWGGFSGSRSQTTVTSREAAGQLFTSLPLSSPICKENDSHDNEGPLAWNCR